jgi:hypothetical protein
VEELNTRAIILETLWTGFRAMLLSLFLHVIHFYGLLVHAQSFVQLPFIPLAVKTPYLNAWSVNKNVTSPNGWPQFFTNNKVSALGSLSRNALTPYSDRRLGWSGPCRWPGVSVDGS